MTLGTETYNEKTNPVSNIIKASSKKIALRKVKAWIKDWIATWKFNAKDNGYKFLGFTTDYKTFCNLRIAAGGTDYFYLKVIEVKK